MSSYHWCAIRIRDSCEIWERGDLGGVLLPVLYEEQHPLGVALRRAAHPRLQPAVVAAGGAGEAAQIILLAFLHVSPLHSRIPYLTILM